MSDPTSPTEGCSHQRTEARKRTKSNGIVVVTMQCLDCGRSLGEKAKGQFNLDKLPAYDPDLYDRLWEAAQPAREKEMAEASAEWWKRYNDYLQSEHWRKVRQKVLDRDYLCQVCFSARAVQAHHLSYESFKRWNVSFPIECVGVCVACHEKLHGTA
jgi:hypothetical protein